jgi:hypothetical protein
MAFKQRLNNLFLPPASRDTMGRKLPKLRVILYMVIQGCENRNVKFFCYSGKAL